MSFMREHKLLVALLAASLLVIFGGIWLIQTSKHEAQMQPQQQNQLHSLTKLAQQAQNQLMATAADTDVPIEDLTPEASVAKAKALEGQAIEVGSDDWCEIMMAKNSDAWTDEERSQFAQHCI